MTRPITAWRAGAVAAVLVTAAAAPALADAPPRAASTTKASPVHVVIAATTDLHGWIEGQPPAAGARTHPGGLDVLAGYVKNLRASHPGRVVLLDGGDLFQGTLASNLFEGEPVLKAYNAIGYDGAALGNHEFDYGPVGPDSSVTGPDQDALGAIKKLASLAKFKLLAANVREKASGQRPSWLQPSILIPLRGAKVGVIGLSTPTTPDVTAPANVVSLEFGDPAAAVLAEAAALRAAGADAIVVVGHMGGSCRNLSDPGDLSSCEPDTEAFNLARALPAGAVDLYLGGHMHRRVRHVVNGIPVVQPAPHGNELAVVDLWIDPARRRVITERTQLRPHTAVCATVYRGTQSCDPRSAPGADVPVEAATFAGRPVVRDAAVQRLMQPYLAQVAAKKAAPLGIRLTAPFTRNYTGPSTLGALVADAMRDVVPGTDFAFANSGGLRANVDNLAPTYGDLYEVLPFDNSIAVLRVTGAQLRQLVSLGGAPGGGVLQVSGLRTTLDYTPLPDAPGPLPRVTALTRVDGSPIDPQATYTVVVSDFLATGGGGFAPVTSTLPPDRIQIRHDLSMRESVIAVLQKKSAAGPFEPKLDGRLTVIDPNAGPPRP